MYVLLARYPGPLVELIRDVPWNPPGWGSAVIQQSILPARLSQLIALRPGGHIPLHADDVATEHAMEPGLSRFHVVLQTNQDCWSLHNGSWQQLEVGGIYWMNPTKAHAAVNFGSTARYHLVIDTEETTWLSRF